MTFWRLFKVFGVGKSATREPDWEGAKAKMVTAISDGNTTLEAYADANARASVQAVGGKDVYSGKITPGAGARFVVNMSSIHIPALCHCSSVGDPKPYKNGYDLGNYRIGDPPPDQKQKTREIVDAALPVPPGFGPKDIYFGAVELNGTVIRYYGDVCLVLYYKDINKNTIVLDRNSFDLVTPPLSDLITRSSNPNAMHIEAARHAGKWQDDLGNMAAVKVLGAIGGRSRRYTNGQISASICDDEDYMEVLRIGSFSTRELEEARVSANDAAQDAATSTRLRSGPPPRAEAILWNLRRRRAERCLRQCSVPTRIVTTAGRQKD